MMNRVREAVTHRLGGYCRMFGYARIDHVSRRPWPLYDDHPAERRTARKESVAFLARMGRIPEWRKSEPGTLGTRAIEPTLTRVGQVFRAFVRRHEQGENPGHPRCEPVSQFRAIERSHPPRLRPPRNGRLDLGIEGLPDIFIRQSREIPSLKAQFVRITRADAGICAGLLLDAAEGPLAPSDSAASTDLRTSDVIAASDAEPSKDSRRKKRAASRCEQGSATRSRRAQAQQMPRLKRHVRHRSECHRITSRLVRKHGTLVLEALDRPNMAGSAEETIRAQGRHAKQDSGSNRSVQSPTRGVVRQQPSYKARREYVEVDLAYPSQTCSRCGAVKASNRKGRRCSCSRCGFSGAADFNAAVKIPRARCAPWRAAGKRRSRR